MRWKMSILIKIFGIAYMTLYCCLSFEMSSKKLIENSLLLMLAVLKCCPSHRMFEKATLRLSTVRLGEPPCACGIYKHPPGSLLLFFVLYSHLGDSKNGQETPHVLFCVYAFSKNDTRCRHGVDRTALLQLHHSLLDSTKSLPGNP